MRTVPSKTGALLVCVALAAAGCAGDSLTEDCTAACEKIHIECQKKTGATLEQCVSECSADEGNHEAAACIAEIPGCDETAGDKCSEIEASVCHQAVKKINACEVALGKPASMKYAGWCSDQATTTVTSGAVKKVPFKSWSETYLACTIDPATCRCPGEPFFTDL
jgi:hypothetical protein